MKRKTTLPVKPVRAAQVPVTVQMLNEMEERLVYKFDSGFHQSRAEVKSEFGSVRSEIAGVKSEVAGIRSNFAAMESKFAAMEPNFARMDFKFAAMESRFVGVESDLSVIKSDVSSIKSELHRVALLVEEQNARNKFVLDGYAQLYELIERKLGR